MRWFKKKTTTEERAEMLYVEGMTLIANGYWKSAFNVIYEAADLGHRGAVGQLAMMYIFGQGCETDRFKGMELLRKSAALGNMYSCYAFSILFDQGMKEVSAEEAEKMCKLAADVGFPEAVLRLEKGFR